MEISVLFSRCQYVRAEIHKSVYEKIEKINHYLSEICAGGVFIEISILLLSERTASSVGDVFEVNPPFVQKRANVVRSGVTFGYREDSTASDNAIGQFVFQGMRDALVQIDEKYLQQDKKVTLIEELGRELLEEKADPWKCVDTKDMFFYSRPDNGSPLPEVDTRAVVKITLPAEGSKYSSSKIEYYDEMLEKVLDVLNAESDGNIDVVDDDIESGEIVIFARVRDVQEFIEVVGKKSDELKGMSIFLETEQVEGFTQIF